MPMTVTVYGDKVDLADELQEEFHQQAKDAVSEGADILLDEIRRLLSMRRGTARTVAPAGAPPEFDVGDLFKSFRKIPPRVRGRTATSGIKSDSIYGIRLEYGLTDGRGFRILPHPYIGPAIANTDERIGQLLEERLS